MKPQKRPKNDQDFFRHSTLAGENFFQGQFLLEKTFKNKSFLSLVLWGFVAQLFAKI